MFDFFRWRPPGFARGRHTCDCFPPTVANGFVPSYNSYINVPDSGATMKSGGRTAEKGFERLILPWSFGVLLPLLIFIGGPLLASGTGRIPKLCEDPQAFRERMGWSPERGRRVAAACAVRRRFQPRILWQRVNNPLLDLQADQTTQGFPEIMLDPSTLDTLLAVYHDTGEWGNQGTLLGLSRSLDGGATWSDLGPIPPPDAGTVYLGEPSLDQDQATGTVHLVSVVADPGQTAFQVGHAWTADGGTGWSFERLFPLSTMAYATPMIRVDNFPSSSCQGCLYITVYDGASQKLLLTRKCPGDPGWGTPVELSPTHAGCDSAPVLGIAANGRLYAIMDDTGCSGCPDHAVEWVVSNDCGATWTVPQTVTCYTHSEDPAASADCGSPALHDHLRVPPRADLAVDPSDALGDTLMVVVQADPDDTVGGADISEVYVLASVDGGSTWANPIIGCGNPGSLGCPLNTESAGDQFFPRIAAEPLGCFQAVWYDRRYDPNNRTAHLRGRVTCDGTWSDTSGDYRISDDFTPAVDFDPVMPACESALAPTLVNLDALFWHVAWTDDSRIEDTPPHAGPRPDADIGATAFQWDAADVAALSLLSRRVTEDTDGDGVLEPCEIGHVWVKLKNDGNVPLTGINASLISNDPDVIVTQGQSGYPDMNPMDETENLTPYEVQVSPSRVCGAPAHMNLQVSAVEGDFTYAYDMNSGDPGTPVAEFDFDAGAQGWSAVNTQCPASFNLWHTVASGTCRAWTGQAYFGRDTACDYDPGTRVCGAWASPDLDLTGAAHPVLHVAYRLEDDGNTDFAALEISSDGGNTWQRLADNQAVGGIADDGAYHDAWYDLNGYGGMTVRLRFVFDSIDSAANAFLGWLIDRVDIRDPMCDACRLFPGFVTVDDAAGNGNGVWEPGESVGLAPTWDNPGLGSYMNVGGSAVLAGSGVTLTDGSALYGDVPPGASVSCAASGDCYAAAAGTSRPQTHWDVPLTETLSTGTVQTWRLHIGGSFQDVPATHLFYRFIETLFHSGITTGCSASDFCPGATLTRAQMAIFLARAIAGDDAAVPSSGDVDGQPYDCTNGGLSLFADVPPASPYCRHVHYLAALHVTGGCTPSEFCPQGKITRAQMAIFLARALAGGDAAIPASGSVGSCSFDCSPGGASCFQDVPPTSSFCAHVHFIAGRGITSGCTPATFCPWSLLTRGQMAVFLVRAFALTLYGP